MNHPDKTDFSKKHGPGVTIHPAIEAELALSVKEGQIPCAVAFKIAQDLGIPVKDVGVAIDVMNYRITKCQLGLFGYAPEKKIVTPAASVDEQMADNITRGLLNNRLPCKTAWAIAEAFHVGKMAVSRACETLGVKIKPCQLGAF